MWGLLLLGTILGVSAIRAGIDNAKMKSEPFKYLDDGTPVYTDRKCQQWANGEKIIATYDYNNNKLVYAGQRSGKVYLDPELETRKRMDVQNEKRKQEAISNGKMSYMRYDHNRKRSITCEVATDKFIARLEGRSDGTYWKYYLPDSEEYALSRPAKGDTGIRITQDEYDKLNITVGGTHYASDLWRYTCRMKNGKVIYERIRGR